MMMSEFIERTGYEPSYDEYKLVEDSYYEFDGDKDEFCKWWKKAQRSGEWAKELRLRQTIETMKQQHEEEMQEKEENLEFYRPFFDRALIAENLLIAIGKEVVATFNLKCKDEGSWRKYQFVSVKYIDNGTIRFINVVEASGCTTSFRINDIEYVEIKVK